LTASRLDSSEKGGRETLFEFRQAGKQVRVSAIDAVTGVEVVIIAPLNATRQQMTSNALAKLRRKLSDTGK